MSSREQERMDAISGALARLIERQNQLDVRMAKIEAAMGLGAPPPAPEPAAPEVTPPPLPTPPEFAAPPPLVTPPPLPQEIPPPQPEPALETRFGLNWLNRIAVVTLLFGVAFFFKYAVDSGWIGPGMRVALGVAAGTLCLSIGEWIWIRGQKVFAQGMTGLGLALLYLSFYASFGFYHLLSQSVAFLLMFLTTGAAAALALHYRAQTVAVLGLIGGYLTPVLLSTGEDRMWTLTGYTLLLNLGAVIIARLRRWPALTYLALAATWMLYAGWATEWLSDDSRLRAFTWLSITFVVFFVASAESAILWLLALNSGAYFAGAYFLLDPRYHDYMGAFALAMALLHALLARIAWNNNEALRHLAAAAALVFATLAIPIQYTGFRITIAWALEGAVLAWLAAQFAHPRYQVGAWLIFALIFARLFARDAAMYSGDALYSTLLNLRFLTFAVSAASFWIATRFARSGESKAVTYGGGHLILLWALAMEVVGWARRTAETQDVANVSSTGVSILMAVYALALVVMGVAARSAVNRILGLGLMALVIGKLYLIDVWQLGRGFRITAFLALGAVLLLVSYLYSRFKPAIERWWRDAPADENPTA